MKSDRLLRLLREAASGGKLSTRANDVWASLSAADLVSLTYTDTGRIKGVTLTAGGQAKLRFLESLEGGGA